MHVDYYRESDDPNELSLFETLRETIYSEVATLISQNENRPHYLIELFKELQLLTTDYLRQRVLYDIKDVVSKYLVDENTDSVSAVSSFFCCGLHLLKSYVPLLDMFTLNTFDMSPWFSIIYSNGDNFQCPSIYYCCYIRPPPPPTPLPSTHTSSRVYCICFSSCPSPFYSHSKNPNLQIPSHLCI